MTVEWTEPTHPGRVAPSPPRLLAGAGGKQRCRVSGLCLPLGLSPHSGLSHWCSVFCLVLQKGADLTLPRMWKGGHARQSSLREQEACKNAEAEERQTG